MGDNYDRVISQAVLNFPLRRIVTPEDVAGAVVSVATGGDLMTGETMIADDRLSPS